MVNEYDAQVVNGVVRLKEEAVIQQTLKSVEERSVHSSD